MSGCSVSRLSNGGDLSKRQERGDGAAARGEADVAAVLKAFNTWAFKREHPCEPQRLKAFVAQRTRRSRPLSFVLYWGKGPRDRQAPPDLQCLDYLHSFRDRIEQAYPPNAEIVLCLTDTHAQHNGHAAGETRRYFSEISAAARERGFETCFLSELVGRYGDGPVDVEPVSCDVMAGLIDSAAKWYRGPGSVEDGARQYLAMNMVEKRAVAAGFPESIFVTFNGSQYRSIFPAEIPKFYMYSMKKGTSIKPWFVDETGQPYEGAAGMRSHEKAA